jgi:hypothetical protein
MNSKHRIFLLGGLTLVLVTFASAQPPGSKSSVKWSSPELLAQFLPPGYATVCVTRFGAPCQSPSRAAQVAFVPADSVRFLEWRNSAQPFGYIRFGKVHGKLEGHHIR